VHFVLNDIPHQHQLIQTNSEILPLNHLPDCFLNFQDRVFNLILHNTGAVIYLLLHFHQNLVQLILFLLTIFLLQLFNQFPSKEASSMSLYHCDCLDYLLFHHLSLMMELLHSVLNHFVTLGQLLLEFFFLLLELLQQFFLLVHFLHMLVDKAFAYSRR